MTVTVTRSSAIGHALEDEIRSRIRARAQYRRDRVAAGSVERYRDALVALRANERVLRLLLSIRRDGIREHQDEERRVDAAMRAHREAVEASDARRRLRVVDVGDHYAGMPA